MVAGGAEVAETGVVAPDGAVSPKLAPAALSEIAARRKRWFTWKRAFVACFGVIALAGAVAFPQRHKFSAQGADLSRKAIGDENTARIEAIYFRIDDRIAKTRYRLLGGSTDPFGTIEPRLELVAQPKAREVVYVLGSTAKLSGVALTADSLGPPAMVLPKTVPLRDNLEAGEGVWTTAGLPRSSPTDLLMAKTFIRPDKSRPYALVGVLLVDSRRVRLNFVGGTGQPAGSRGVRGAGQVPRDAYPTLLAAWTGGFKGEHGSFGMWAEGREFLPLRSGLASVVAYKDGTIKVGEWGRDFTWDDNITGVRQNAVLLVDKGEVSRRVNEGNDTWGYVAANSAEFITWRSAIGITKDGNLIVAGGNSLSAATLAQALWAAGAYYAMQLDINSPYVLTGLYTPQPDGSIKSEKFMEAMPDNPARFLKAHERDLQYITLDETRYR
jgi:hypothetical protein